MRLRSAVALLLLASAGAARAGEMEVNPVLVSLSRDEKSGVITIRNRSAEPSRYQISVLAWDQGPAGEMKLSATQAVVAFPPVLSLAPQEAKIVRVGTTQGFGPVERSFRLFVEELPPPARRDEPSRVQVLSRVGIPVFLAPAAPVVEKATVGPVLVEGAKASFAIRNLGNVRVRPAAVKIALHDAAGASISERPLEAWYVLASGERRYDVDVPPDRCAEVRAVAVEVTLPREVLRARADVPRGACAR